MNEHGPNAACKTCDTDAAILRAARDLLAEGGLEALSMRAVAARVGTSAAAIYHWFESKDALVDRVVLDGFERSEAYLWKSIEVLPKGSIERLVALGEAYIRFAFANQQYFKIIFAILPPSRRHLEDVPGKGGYRVLRECVVDAMEAGNIRGADPDLVVLYLWAVVHGLVTIFMACDPGDVLPECAPGVTEAQEPTVQVFRQLHEMIERGFVAGEPPTRGSRSEEPVPAPAASGTASEGRKE